MAPCSVLYGVLSAENRTSRYGRKIRASPNSSARASVRATNGSRTDRSYRSLLAVHQSLVLFASSSA